MNILKKRYLKIMTGTGFEKPVCNKPSRMHILVRYNIRLCRCRWSSKVNFPVFVIRDHIHQRVTCFALLNVDITIELLL